MSNTADQFLAMAERQIGMCQRIQEKQAKAEEPLLKELRRKIDAGETLDLHEYQTAQHLGWA